jgi:hypothetical protein
MIVQLLVGSVVSVSQHHRPRFGHDDRKTICARRRAPKQIAFHASGRAPQLAGDDDLARTIHSVHLEHVLGDINADGANLHVDDPPPVIRCSTITLWHIRCRERAPSTTSFATKWAVSAMSAFPPIATKLRTSLEVRLVPQMESCAATKSERFSEHRLSGVQLIEQRLRLLQVERVEPFREPTID